MPKNRNGYREKRKRESCMNCRKICDLYRLVWESVEKSIQSKRSLEFPVRKSFENVLVNRAVRTTVGKGENYLHYQ